jgi:hypothetical protein
MKHYLRFERLGLIGSFRRFCGVCCKTSCYWDFEPSHSMNHSHIILLYLIHYSLVLLKDLFSGLGNIENRVYFAKKLRQNWCSDRDSLFGFGVEYSACTQPIFGQHPVRFAQNEPQLYLDWSQKIGKCSDWCFGRFIEFLLSRPFCTSRSLLHKWRCWAQCVRACRSKCPHPPHSLGILSRWSQSGKARASQRAIASPPVVHVVPSVGQQCPDSYGTAGSVSTDGRHRTNSFGCVIWSSSGNYISVFYLDYSTVVFRIIHST